MQRLHDDSFSSVQARCVLIVPFRSGCYTQIPLSLNRRSIFATGYCILVSVVISCQSSLYFYSSYRSYVYLYLLSLVIGLTLL